MFKKYKDKAQNEVADYPEWEEVDHDAVFTDVDSPDNTDEVTDADIQTEALDAADSYSSVNAADALASEPYYGAYGFIEVDGGTVNLSEFPALRLSHGEREDARSDDMPEVQEYDPAEERDLSDLILKYAQMDDDAADMVQLGENGADQEELPALFRTEYREEEETELLSSEECEDPVDEFTMESELEKQREISDELFDYIHTINRDAEELIRGREEKYRKSKNTRVYDPYNLSFNSRYDDTDEVLSSTPEIPMTPKYKLED